MAESAKTCHLISQALEKCQVLRSRPEGSHREWQLHRMNRIDHPYMCQAGENQQRVCVLLSPLRTLEWTTSQRLISPVDTSHLSLNATKTSRVIHLCSVSLEATKETHPLGAREQDLALVSLLNLLKLLASVVDMVQVIHQVLVVANRHQLSSAGRTHSPRMNQR